MEMVNLEMRSLGLPPHLHLSVQVGIDSGFAIAGVIGHKTFQYDLCGDAVNTAARMCSYSEPGRVNVSERTHALVRHRFSSEEQAEREIKGKGRMKTYFLTNTPPPATTSKAVAVRCAPALDAPLPLRSSSPPRPRVSFTGDTRVSSGTLTPPRESASRVSAGSVTASEPGSSEEDEGGGEDDGADGAEGSEGAEGGQGLREKRSPADISTDGIETSEKRDTGVELPLSPLSC